MAFAPGVCPGSHSWSCGYCCCLAACRCRLHAMQVLCKDGATSVTQADLKSMMAGILLSHPGLEFLQDTPEFQDRHVPDCQSRVSLKVVYLLACLQSFISLILSLLSILCYRYAETVIYRIFYALDRCGAGRLSLRDLKRYRAPPANPVRSAGLRGDRPRINALCAAGVGCCAHCRCWMRRKTSIRYWNSSHMSTFM